jgi:phage terminase large subunit-like protein
MGKDNEVQQVKVKRVKGSNTLVKVKCYVGVDYATMKDDFSIFAKMYRPEVWEKMQAIRYRNKNVNGNGFNRKA